ncbi:MAG TPA: FAD-dependent oxidoreductase [Tepidiformaceae bacterium]
MRQPPPSEIQLPATTVPVRSTTDVLVVGGGTAGVAAAVAAARNGADTLLVERGTYLGGLATGGLIILLLTMDDGRGQQVIGGLCQEVVDRLAHRNAAFMPPPEEWGRDDDRLVEQYRRWGLVNGHGPHNVRYSVAYDAEEMKFALERLCVESRVRLMYGAVASEPIGGEGRIEGVVFQGKNGRFAVPAGTVIDASGDLDVLSAAGAACEKEKVAPWLWFTMGGVREPEAAQGAGLRFFRTIGAGQVLLPWGATGRVSRMIDATDVDDITYASVACRELVMAEVDRLRKDVPGFENAYLCHIADQLDVTESRRLVGRHVLSRDDLDAKFGDVVAVTGHWTKYDAVYNIPYRALLPRGLNNALAVGRCISADHRAHHATKEIPACFATGEAAGTAAAIGLKHGVEVADVDVEALQRQLVSQGAILWPDR